MLYAIALRRETYRLVSYVLTTEIVNTVEWLDGLVERLNAWAEAVDEPDRVKRLREVLRIVRATQQVNDGDPAQPIAEAD